MSEDPAFSDYPWISAVEHLRYTARLHLFPKENPLSVELEVIDKGLNHLDIVRKVIAIIDGYECTDEGDAMVILKDPSWRMGGYIRKEVCEHAVYGPDIRVGSVVLLRNVQYVVETGYNYLNIHLQNIEGIWTKENCSSPQNSNEDTPTNGDSYVEDTQNEENIVEDTYEPDSDESYSAYGTFSLKDKPSGSGAGRSSLGMFRKKK